MVAAVALIALGLLVATAIAASQARTRAWAVLGALVLTPVLLVGHLQDTSAWSSVRDRPALAAAAAVVGLVAVAAGAVLLARRPAALALAALVAVPFRVPIAIGGSTANLLVGLYAVVGAGALAYAVPRLRGAETLPERRSGGLERVLALFVVLYAVQAAYSVDADKALENMVFFYAPFGLLLVALREVRWGDGLAGRAVGVLTGLALLFAAVGFVEYATRHLLFNPKVIASNQLESSFRVNSLFFDPNIYGRFLAIVMIALATVVAFGLARRTVGLASVALAVLWAGLVLTLSQSSFLALLVGLAVVGGLRWSPRGAAVLAGVLVLAAGGVVLLAPDAIRLQGSDSKSVDSATSGRSDLVAGGVRLFTARPLQGQGSGSFAREFRRREDASGQRATSASHTTPITVAAEQGLPGLLAYAVLLVLALRRLGRRARSSPERVAVLAAFLALVAHSLFYAAFLEDPLTWVALAVGIALAADAPPARRRRPEVAAAVAGAA